MFIACLKPQGNFDPNDFGWTQHPDFGGQLVYVKELSLALGRLGQRVDIITGGSKIRSGLPSPMLRTAIPDGKMSVSCA